MASIPAPTRANSPATSVDLGPTPSPPSLPSAAQGHVNGVLPVPLSQPLPTPEPNLDFMSDEYLSELGHHATELCASVAGIGMALNVRRYLGYSSFREAQTAADLFRCCQEYIEVYAAMEHFTRGHRPVRSTCRLFCPSLILLRSSLFLSVLPRRESASWPCWRSGTPCLSRLSLRARPSISLRL